jgi:DNA polymerase-1
MWPVVERDFSRLVGLEEELKFTVDTSLSVDIETAGSFDPLEGDILCVGVSHRPGYGCVLPPGDPRIDGCLSTPKIVGQNFILYDWWWLHNHGYTIPKETAIWDTRYAGKLLNPDTPNDLVYLTGEFAAPPIRGYWKAKQNYRDDVEQVCGIDIDATLRVKLGQHDALKQRGQLGIMTDFIMPLSKVTFDMRAAGMKINKERMEHASNVIREDLLVGRRGLPDNEEWNVTKHGYRTENQHVCVQDHLYHALRLPVQTKRESGKRTANQEAIDELRSRALDFINRIDKLRDLSKLESSFLRYKLSPRDFVHPALNLGGSTKGKHESGRGTATFRFSCSDPNAQQIPGCKCSTKCYGQNPDCRGARDIFIPDYPEWEVMSVDLKQAEVVGFLWYAEAWDVLEKILRGRMDAHQMVANKILSRESNKEERDDFKTTTFAILYGEHETTTAARLQKPVEEIREARDYYFKMLPGVSDYRNMMIGSAMDRGYVESPFRVRRYMRLTREKGRAANQACNMPIQNIPPMVIGTAMINIHRELPKPARLWMQVHDEILCVYPKTMRDVVAGCVLDNLRKPVPQMPAAPLGMAGGIVFNCDVEVGPHWGAVRKIDEVVELEKIGEDPWRP